MDTEQGAGPLDVPRPGPSDAPLSPTAEEPSLDGLITSAGASPHANVPSDATRLLTRASAVVVIARNNSTCGHLRSLE
eukprot:9387029-Pyramimonas_sp.AAC.1